LLTPLPHPGTMGLQLVYFLLKSGNAALDGAAFGF
jgi:hypothetical protein